MKYTLLFLSLAITIVLTPTQLIGQTLSLQKSPTLAPGAAQSVGMSAERIARIDKMCQEAIDQNNLPAIVALVVKDGIIVHHKAYGYADAPSQKILKTNDIFRIASQTKAITSTAVMMLWEQGYFQLDDPISKYIPAFANAQVLDSLYVDGHYTTIPADKAITIRHLLTHTSGIGYGVIDGDPDIKKIYADAGIIDLYTTENISIEDNIQKLAQLPLHHHPGEEFTYSEGLDVLGYFIEIISGEPLDVYFKKHIFEPLGMDDTAFYLPITKASRLVTLHKKENEEWVGYPVTFYDPSYPINGAKRFFSGGAGLSSTALDYAKFLQMYLNQGELNGIRLLSRTTVDVIMSNQIGNLWNDNGSYYGLAFGVTTPKGQARGGRGSTGTFDWGGYFNTQYFADPEEKLIGILMKQTQGPVNDQTSWKFRQLVGQAIDD